MGIIFFHSKLGLSGYLDQDYNCCEPAHDKAITLITETYTLIDDKWFIDGEGVIRSIYEFKDYQWGYVG